jgi:hypothetical protein
MAQATRKKRAGTEAKRLTDLIEDAIDRGATTVEEIHKAIADLPLRVLEQIEFLRKPLKEVRRVQDRSIGAVYDLIREINQRVGKLAAQMLRRRRAIAERATRASRARTR